MAELDYVYVHSTDAERRAKKLRRRYCIDTNIENGVCTHVKANICDMRTITKLLKEAIKDGKRVRIRID